MPQVIRVLCCCRCGTFQNDILKKVSKWICKICNEKQSLQQIYFVGNGMECRKVTQELNYKRMFNGIPASYASSECNITALNGSLSYQKEADQMNSDDIDAHVDAVVKLEALEECGLGDILTAKGGSKWDVFMPTLDDCNKEVEVETNCECGK